MSLYHFFGIFYTSTNGERCRWMAQTGSLNCWLVNKSAHAMCALDCSQLIESLTPSIFCFIWHTYTHSFLFLCFCLFVCASHHIKMRAIVTHKSCYARAFQFSPACVRAPKTFLSSAHHHSHHRTANASSTPHTFVWILNSFGHSIFHCLRLVLQICVPHILELVCVLPPSLTNTWIIEMDAWNACLH